MVVKREERVEGRGGGLSKRRKGLHELFFRKEKVVVSQTEI